MAENREVWIKLKDPTPEGERIVQDSQSQRGTVQSPDQDRQAPTPPPVDLNVLKPLYVIFGLLVGWIALVLVLGALLPADHGKPSIRGVIYLGYIAIATVVFARFLKRQHIGKND